MSNKIRLAKQEVERLTQLRDARKRKVGDAATKLAAAKARLAKAEARDA